MKVQKLTRFFLKGGFITCTVTEPTETGFIQVELEADREYPSEIYARDKEDNILEAHSVTLSLRMEDQEGIYGLLTDDDEDQVDAALREDDWQLLKEQAKEIEELKKEIEELKKENAFWAAEWEAIPEAKEIEELKKENAALKDEIKQLKDELKKYEGAQVIYGSPAPWTQPGQIPHQLSAYKEENAALKDEIKQLYEALEGSVFTGTVLEQFPKPVGRPRGTRNHCGLCGEPGHNRRTCPSHPKRGA